MRMKKTILAFAIAVFCLMGAAGAEARDNKKHSRHNHHSQQRVVVKQYKYKYVPVVRYYKAAPYKYAGKRHPHHVRYRQPSYYYWNFWR